MLRSHLGKSLSRPPCQLLRDVRVALPTVFLSKRSTSSAKTADAKMTDAKAASSEGGCRALHPPDAVRGMTELRREAFDKVASVPCFEVDASMASVVLRHVKEHLLKLPHFKPVRESSEDSRKKLFVLDPCKVNEWKDLKEAARNTLVSCGINDFACQELTFSYDNWTAEEVLRAVIGQPDAAGYSLVGHILHLNLREHLEPYKGLIGQVYLDKVKNVTCVVNKAQTIENTFRNFSMEVLAGEPQTKVEVKENGVRFKFDFAEVYWNPRLATEHSRVVSLMSENDVLYDVFAGVGPFAIPAARKGCHVHANDLNPHSFSWLKHNVEINKVTQKVTTYNMDGRDFIRDVIGRDLRSRTQTDVTEETNRETVHICMNLPSLATEFLDAFRGLLDPATFVVEANAAGLRVRVHCYCFVKEEDQVAKALRKVEEGLGSGLGADTEVKFVRSVAPNKDMMRVSFGLPLEVLVLKVDVEEVRPPPKRCKIDDERDSDNV